MFSVLTALHINSDEPEPLAHQLAYMANNETQLIPVEEEAKQTDFSHCRSLCHGIRSKQEAWPRKECFSQLLAPIFCTVFYINLPSPAEMSVESLCESTG